MSYKDNKPEWLEEEEVAEQLAYEHQGRDRFGRIRRSPDEEKVNIVLDAVCHDCKRRHRIDVIPAHFGDAAFTWHNKHIGHNFEFLTLRRIIPAGFDDSMFERAGKAPWWLEYDQNSDFKLAYDTVHAITITLGSLASSATAGRESASISNASNKWVDVRLSAKIKTGTTPTVNTPIGLYVIGTLDDSPTWPDVFTGSNAAATVTNQQIMDQLPCAQAVLVSATTGVTYPFQRCQTVAECLGFVPSNWSVFVLNTTVAALDATDGSHVVNYQGCYFSA